MIWRMLFFELTLRLILTRGGDDVVEGVTRTREYNPPHIFLTSSHHNSNRHRDISSYQNCKSINRSAISSKFKMGNDGGRYVWSSCYGKSQRHEF